MPVSAIKGVAQLEGRGFLARGMDNQVPVLVYLETDVAIGDGYRAIRALWDSEREIEMKVLFLRGSAFFHARGDVRCDVVLQLVRLGGGGNVPKPCGWDFVYMV